MITLTPDNAHLLAHPAILSVESWCVRICQECPGSRALTQALGDLGVRPSHGVCDACAPAFMARARGERDAYYQLNPPVHRCKLVSA